MPTTTRALILCIALLASPCASGFELFTHALITFNAYKEARLGSDFSLLADLGLLNPGATLPYQYDSLGKIYIDVLLPQAKIRTIQPIETLAFPDIPDNPLGSGNGFDFTRDRFKVSGWLMLGAIREDDNTRYGAYDDPYVPTHVFDRLFNHFFDPARNRPFTIPFPGLGLVYARDNRTNGDTTIHRAPDWAIGTDDAFASLLARGADRLNHFTTLDAREAMWRALALKSIGSAGAMHDLPPSTIPGNSSTQRLRNAYWATTFRALGDVLHLNQDMAQPQHTRNEAHSGAGPQVAQTAVTGHESMFELYVDARAKGRSFDFPGIGTIPNAALNLSDYPIPRFNRYSDYWSTGVPAGSPVDQPLSGYINGKGLADYSNRGFFTAAKNFGSREYGYPSSNPGDYVPESAAYSFPGISGTIKTQYLKGKVTDTLGNSPTTNEIRMTVQGIFDDVVNEYGITLASRYTLDANVFDDQANLLIPRAVAYSAGILDYFFRGELQIALPDDGVYAVVDHTQNQCADLCGFPIVKVKLKNATPNNEVMFNGVFVAVAKYHRNLCYRSDLSGDPGGPLFNPTACRSAEEEITVSDPASIRSLASFAVQPIKFTFPKAIPINATDIYLQVVFRGQLGNETDAVVVTTKNISEPNYVAFVNDFDYHYNATLDTFQSVAPDPMTQTITQINVKLGNATTPVATLVNLGARKYAQLAFLTDLGTSGTEKLVIDYSAPGFGSPFTYDLPISTFDSPGGAVYQRLPRNISSYRGMWSDYRLDFFQGGGYSIAACPAQDTRRICTSAGLTSIPPANAVAWTINFP